MSNLFNLKKDGLFRLHYKEGEFNKILLKSLLYSDNIKFIDKFYYNKIFYSISNRFGISRVRRFSVKSGFTRSIYRLFKMSRHESKKYASFGFLVGLRKSSF